MNSTECFPILLENQQIFFTHRQFSFFEGCHRLNFFFSLERKFFLSPFFNFSVSICNFFCLNGKEKSIDCFWKIMGNQQIFFYSFFFSVLVKLFHFFLWKKKRNPKKSHRRTCSAKNQLRSLKALKCHAVVIPPIAFQGTNAF